MCLTKRRRRPLARHMLFLVQLMLLQPRRARSALRAEGLAEPSLSGLRCPEPPCKAREDAVAVAEKIKAARATVDDTARLADGLATLGNMILQAIEADLRTAPCGSGRLEETCDSRDAGLVPAMAAAAAAFNEAISLADHAGAHYGWATTLQLYPGLVAAAGSPESYNFNDTSVSARIHLCASHHRVIATREQELGGAIDLLDGWEAARQKNWARSAPMGADTVLPQGSESGEENRARIGHRVAFVVLGGASGADAAPVLLEGADGVVHSVDIELARRHEQQRHHQQQHYRSPMVYRTSSGCMARLYAQLGRPGQRRRHFPAVASAVGYAGGEYYHWLLEGVPRVLLLRKALLQPYKAGRQAKVPLVVPSSEGGSRRYIAESITLITNAWQGDMAPFSSVVELPEEGVRISAEAIFLVDWRAMVILPAADDAAAAATAPAAAAAADVAAAGAPALPLSPPELPMGAELLPPPLGLLLLRQTLVPEIPPKRQRNLVVYAARPPGGKRGVVNEAEVVAALEAAAAEAGARLRVFRGETEGIAAAVQTFSRARVVVGVHGAALANAVFCAAGTPLMEVRPPEPALRGMFEHLARAVGLRYVEAGKLPANAFEAPLLLDAAALAEAVLEALGGSARGSAASEL